MSHRWTQSIVLLAAAVWAGACEGVAPTPPPPEAGTTEAAGNDRRQSRTPSAATAGLAPRGAAGTSAWPVVEQVDAQPLLSQVQRLVETLDYIGNPLPETTVAALARLAEHSDGRRTTQAVEELLDPFCVAAVTVGTDGLEVALRRGEHEIVEHGWRSYLVKVHNQAALPRRLRATSPEAEPLPHAPQQEVASRWLELSMFDGRPLATNLSGLPLEYRIIQLYSRDAGRRTATLTFAIDAEPGGEGRLIREWRFAESADGWEGLDATTATARDGVLHVVGGKSDTAMHAKVGPASGDLALRFQAETDQSGFGRVFWWTEEDQETGYARVAVFPLMPGGRQQYEVDLPVEGTLAGIRIDPSFRRSDMRFDWIDLVRRNRETAMHGNVAASFDAQPAFPVSLEVIDKPGEPAVAAFEIRDSLGRIYPEQMKRLAPDFFFQRQIYRADGEEIRLPAGDYQVVCSRGPHSIPETKQLVVGDQPTRLTYRVRRWIDPTAYGYWSGDHHIHAAGCLHYENPTQGVLPRDMLRHTMGEDLNVGCCLTWGPCFDYQKQFFAGESVPVAEHPYLLRYDVEVSGFGSHASGHLNLLGLTEQIYPGGESTDHWPTLGLNTLRWAKRQGAVCGPAHSASGLTNYVDRLEQYEPGPDGLPHYNIPAFDGIGANEYIVDVTHRVPGPDGALVPAVDFIATMNTARREELNMWYHTLNCGFRVRSSGETDFPCLSGERVGIGRVYVNLGDRLNFQDWVAALQQGRSYVSDGSAHIIDFQARPAAASKYLPVGVDGSQIEADGPTTVVCRAQCAILKDANSLERRDAENVDVELIAGGYPVATASLPADGNLHDLQFRVEVERSTWLALRIYPRAHSNPFFVIVDGKPIRTSRASADWCLRCVEQCWRAKQATYAPDEQQQAREAYRHAQSVYRQILAECRESSAGP